MRTSIWAAMAASMLAACTEPDGSTAPVVGEGERCGGWVAERCAAGTYCDFPMNTCGHADEPGTCRALPTACDAAVGEPIEGCDGNTYPDACAAAMAGSDAYAIN